MINFFFETLVLALIIEFKMIFKGRKFKNIISRPMSLACIRWRNGNGDKVTCYRWYGKLSRNGRFYLVLDVCSICPPLTRHCKWHKLYTRVIHARNNLTTSIYLRGTLFIICRIHKFLRYRYPFREFWSLHIV